MLHLSLSVITGSTIKTIFYCHFFSQFTNFKTQLIQVKLIIIIVLHHLHGRTGWRCAETTLKKSLKFQEKYCFLHNTVLSHDLQEVLQWTKMLIKQEIPTSHFHFQRTDYYRTCEKKMVNKP